MKNTTPIEPIVWPIPEAARRVGYGETKFREAIRRGEIGFVRNGDRMLIEDEELRRWLRDRREYVTEESA